MKTISSIEEEINQIRLNIYQETKQLTSEQYKERLKNITDTAAKKYGFKVIPSIDRIGNGKTSKK
jgi:hypothetical protein